MQVIMHLIVFGNSFRFTAPGGSLVNKIYMGGSLVITKY
jgi:hypothetical protein